MEALAGSSLMWESYGRAAPQWYIDEFEAYIDAGESPEPLSDNIQSHVAATVEHYKGKNTNYKLYNEPIHNEWYRANYDDIWNKTIQAARQVDPNVVLGINDYEILSADMGRCMVDLMDGYEFDYIGVQSLG